MKRTLAVVILCSCARAVVTSAPLPADWPATKPARAGPAYAGFDKRDFPGLRDMQTWYATSPYEWVGYYLPSPCFTGTPWTGNRQALLDQRWGLAVIYVGLQPSRSTTAATRCSQDTLSAPQGKLDGDDAVNVAAADGFPAGTTIFLDVERSDPYPPALDAYVRAWAQQVLARRFTPGIYAHRSNAEALFASVKAVYVAAGDMRSPRFWVSNSQAFDLNRSPAESGFPFAAIWQNPSDTSETYGGVAFRVDANVASTRNPSYAP